MPNGTSSSVVAAVSSLGIVLTSAENIAPLKLVKLDRHISVGQVVSLNLRRLVIHLESAPVSPRLTILTEVLLATHLLFILLCGAERNDWAILVATLGAVFIIVARRGYHDGLVTDVVATCRVDRLVHQVLQPARLLQIARILRIHYLKEDLLHVSLIGLVLNDLGELYAVYFGRDEALHFVEKALLLG